MYVCICIVWFVQEESHSLICQCFFLIDMMQIIIFFLFMSVGFFVVNTVFGFKPIALFQNDASLNFKVFRQGKICWFVTSKIQNGSKITYRFCYNILHPFSNPSILSSVLPSILPSVSNHKFIHLFVCPSVCSSIHPSVHTSVHASVHLQFILSLISMGKLKLWKWIFPIASTVSISTKVLKFYISHPLEYPWKYFIWFHHSSIIPL